MADTQIDELRLDITVEDKTSGESSDKKVKNLASAISRLNKNLQAFDNAKFTKVFENMSKGLDPFVKKIESVSSALASLATIVSKGGLDKAVKEVTNKVPELKTETTSDSGRKSEPVHVVQGQAEELGNISEQTKKLAKVSNDWAGKLTIAKRQLELIEGKLASGTLKESQIVAYQSKRISLLDKIDKIEAQITKEKENQVQSDEDDGKKEQKKTTSLSKLLKSFGRIAMYRAVRRTIQEITQAFMESIDGIARYNREFRDTMGSLQSSLAKVRTSIGVAFYQVLIIIEPLLTRIANVIVNFSNSLSKVIANLRGVATYTKINTEYMKEYQSTVQGALLSFDTFTTLGSQQSIDYSKMFETGTDALDTKSFSEMENVLKGVSQLLPPIFEFLSLIGEIIKTFSPIIEDIIKQMDISLGVTNGILKIITGNFSDGIQDIAKSFKNLWVDIGKNFEAKKYIFIQIGEKIKNVFIQVGEKIKNVFIQIGEWFKRLFKIISNFFVEIYNNTIGKVINEIKKIGTNAKSFIVNIGTSIGKFVGFANGGMMDAKSFTGAGTMYALAGERGAEVVAQGSAGTGVLNVDQFADAMVSALVRYGAARDTSNGTQIVLDGNKVGQLVARNVGFRDEANRRNPGLNWK